MRQRIAIIIPGLGGGGGTERVIVLIANALMALGKYEIDMVSIECRLKGPAFNDLRRDVTMVPLNAVDAGYNSMLACLFSTRDSFPSLLQYFRKRQPAVVLTNWFNSPLIWLKERHSLNFRIVIIEHVNFRIWHNSLRGKFGAEVMRWTCRHFYKKADAIVGVSKGVCNELISLGIAPRDKTHCIYNPAVTPSLKNKAQEQTGHPWFTEDTPVIAATGRLALEKDFATLLKAFHELLKSIDARLIILGEGKERPRLEKLRKTLSLDDKVDLPGHVLNPYAYMSKAKLFVLSSVHEGLAIVLIEAMACGTTVVSTACPYGPDEILDKGKYGYLVPVGDVNALAQAMLQAIAKPFPREELIKRAMEFTDHAAAVTYDTLIEKLTAGRAF